MAYIDKCIIHGNFTEKHKESLLQITKMQISKSKDIKFELMFVYSDENRLFLIDTLESLPKDEWIVCTTTVSGVLQLQLGIPNQKVKGLEKFSSFNSYATGAPIFYGKLQNLLRSSLFIKESDDIGLAYISSILLIKKLDQLPLSTLLTTDTVLKRLYTKLSPEKIKLLRKTSKDVKSTVDRNRETIIKFNPTEFDYSSADNIHSVCKQFGKIPNECTFEVEFIMEKTGGNKLLFTPSIDAFKLTGVKLIAKFFLHLSLDDATTEKAYQLLFETIASLPNIVSLDITFGTLYTESGSLEKKLLNDSFTNCQVAKVLKSLRNLSILRIYNVEMSWIPFFDCLKNLNLIELILSQVNLVTVGDATERIFLDEFMLAVHTITTLGIKNSCEIDEKYAIDILLLALPALPKLTSLDFSENDLYGDPKNFRGVFTDMLKNCKQLKTLDISHNNFIYEGENGDSEGFHDLCLILAELPNLEVLKMSYTEMNREAIEILIPVLKTLKKLKMLDISNNSDIEDEDVTILQDELPKVVVKETTIFKGTPHLTNEELAQRCIWLHNNHS
jgi:hypothetical protein